MKINKYILIPVLALAFFVGGKNVFASGDYYDSDINNLNNITSMVGYEMTNGNESIIDNTFGGFSMGYTAPDQELTDPHILVCGLADNADVTFSNILINGSTPNQITNTLSGGGQAFYIFHNSRLGDSGFQNVKWYSTGVAGHSTASGNQWTNSITADITLNSGDNVNSFYACGWLNQTDYNNLIGYVAPIGGTSASLDNIDGMKAMLISPVNNTKEILAYGIPIIISLGLVIWAIFWLMHKVKSQNPKDPRNRRGGLKRSEYNLKNRY